MRTRPTRVILIRLDYGVTLEIELLVIGEHLDRRLRVKRRETSDDDQ